MSSKKEHNARGFTEGQLVPLNHGCCEDANKQQKHPFADYKSARKGKSFDFSTLANPIPAEISDPLELQRTFREYNFIPYAGNQYESAYGLLPWLNSMKNLSSTHGSCIESIKTYAFSDKFKIYKDEFSDFCFGGSKADDNEVSVETQKAFARFIQDNINTGGKSLKDIVCGNYDDLKDNGNYYIELIFNRVGNSTKYTINVHKQINVCYINKSLNSNKEVAISPYFDYDYLRRNPPRQVAVFPKYTVSRNRKTWRTIIHIKNGNYNYYGRPDWLPSFIYAYREFQDANYLTKIGRNNFTGQVFIEVEEDDPQYNIFAKNSNTESGFDSLGEQLSHSFSNKSDDPQTLMLVSRPYGAKPAHIFQFKPNTSHEFFKTSSELNEIKIIRAHGWSKRFLGENLTQGFSTNVFLDELRVKEVGILNRVRDKASLGINTALREVVKFSNIAEFRDLIIKPKNSFDLLEEFIITGDRENSDKNNIEREIRGENTNNGVGGS